MGNQGSQRRKTRSSEEDNIIYSLPPESVVNNIEISFAARENHQKKKKERLRLLPSVPIPSCWQTNGSELNREAQVCVMVGISVEY